MAEVNPFDLLGPAWAQYKRRHTNALKQLHKSFSYESQAIKSWLYNDAVDWDGDARWHWRVAVELHLGAHSTIEWQGDAYNPRCVVNGVLMFS